MKKFSLIYALSFLPYLACEMFWFFNNNVDKYLHSFTTLVSIFSFLGIIAFIYQLIYIIKLGRKDNVSARRSVGQFFLYRFLSESISVIINYIVIYYNGFIDRAFISGHASSYYEAEGWDKYSRSWFFPKQILFFSALYAIIYFMVGRIYKKRKEVMAGWETDAKTRSNRRITFLTILPLLIMLLIIIFGVKAAKN